jgi:hypothetical protein
MLTLPTVFKLEILSQEMDRATWCFQISFLRHNHFRDQRFIGSHCVLQTESMNTHYSHISSHSKP